MDDNSKDNSTLNDKNIQENKTEKLENTNNNIILNNDNSIINNIHNTSSSSSSSSKILTNNNISNTIEYNIGGNKIITDIPEEPTTRPICTKLYDDIFILRLPKHMKNISFNDNNLDDTINISGDSLKNSNNTKTSEDNTKTSDDNTKSSEGNTKISEEDKYNNNKLINYCKNKITEMGLECGVKSKSSGKNAKLYMITNKILDICIIIGSVLSICLESISQDTNIPVIIISSFISLFKIIYTVFNISTKGVEYKNKSIQLKKLQCNAEEYLFLYLNGPELLELTKDLRSDIDQLDLQLYELSNNTKSLNFTSGSISKLEIEE